jgi:DnaJ-domain-containing protein 1
MDDDFQRRLRQEAQARQVARRVLGVGEDADLEAIRRAWRRACLRYHPDRNPDDEDAERRLILVNCAYQALTGGDPCRDLLDREPAQPTRRDREAYDLDNAWGLFLWWRDKFFG